MERSGTLSEPSDNSTTPYIKKETNPFGAASHDAVLLGHDNVASTEVVLEEMLDKDILGTSFCIGRGAGEDGSVKPQSYIVWMSNTAGKTKLTYGHRGGGYVKPTEVFGPGVFYNA